LLIIAQDYEEKKYTEGKKERPRPLSAGFHFSGLYFCFSLWYGISAAQFPVFLDRP